MSYNISHSAYIGSGRLTITKRALRKLLEDYEDDLAEGNFLHVLHGKIKGYGDEEEIVVENFWWYGEYSGHSYRDILPKILSFTKGTADILFVWEGGNDFSGLHVENGVCQERKVEVSLTELPR